MREIVRIGAISALLIAAVGCASSKGVSAPSEGDGRPAAVAAKSNARSPAETLNVLFAFGRSDLNSTAQTDLRPLVKKLRENRKLTVSLEGYADSVGARDYNLVLSQKRVESVRRYLVDNGIEPSRIRAVGLGPVADGRTPEEQAKSRRVTVKLMAASD